MSHLGLLIPLLVLRMALAVPEIFMQHCEPWPLSGHLQLS